MTRDAVRRNRGTAAENRFATTTTTKPMLPRVSDRRRRAVSSLHRRRCGSAVVVAARRGEAPGRLRGNRREPRRERLTSTTRGTGPMKLDPPAACTESQGSGRVWNPLSSVFWTWPGKSSWTSWRRPGWTSSPCRWTSSCRWSSWRRWSSWPWSKSSSWTQPGW